MDEQSFSAHAIFFTIMCEFTDRKLPTKRYRKDNLLVKEKTWVSSYRYRGLRHPDHE